MTKYCVLAILVFSVTATMSLATDQERDRVIYDGRTWYIHWPGKDIAFPLDSFLKQNPKARDILWNPEKITPASTANWRGYIATWGVSDGVLYLTGMTDGTVQSNFKKAFPKRFYKKRVRADWVSGKMTLTDSAIGLSTNETSFPLYFLNGKLVPQAQIKRWLILAANRGFQRDAFSKLVQLKIPDVFELLANRLSDPRLFVRCEAAWFLGQLQDPRAVRLLQQTVQSKYPSLVLASVTGLVQLGSKAAPAEQQLLALLDKGYGEFHPSARHFRFDRHNRHTATTRIHLAAMNALANIPTKNSRKALLKILTESPHASYRSVAAKALASMNAIPELMKAAEHSPSGEELFVLGTLKHKPAVPLLLRIVNDPKQPENLRAAAISALGRMEDRRATKALLEEALKPRSDTARRAMRGLAKLADPSTLKPLVSYIRTTQTKSGMPYSAVIAIGNIDTEEARIAFRELRDHPKSLVIEAMLTSLNTHATREDIPLILELLSRPDLRESSTPSKALTRLLPDSSIPMLNALPALPAKQQRSVIPVLLSTPPSRTALFNRLKQKQYHAIKENVVRLEQWRQEHSPQPIKPTTSESLWDVMVTYHNAYGGRPLPPKPNPVTADALWNELTQRLDAESRKDNRLPDVNVATNVLRQPNMPKEHLDRMIALLANPGDIPPENIGCLIRLLRWHRVFTPEAMTQYQRYLKTESRSPRSEVYRTLWAEGSDESVQTVLQRAVDDDDLWARIVVADAPDRRAIPAMKTLVARAIKNKDSWLRQYVHKWPALKMMDAYTRTVSDQPITKKWRDDEIKSRKETLPEPVILPKNGQ